MLANDTTSKIEKLMIVLDSVSFVAKFCIVAIKSRKKKGNILL
jgi:general stress protein CsbA